MLDILNSFIFKYRIHIPLVFFNTLFLFSNCKIDINNITAILCFTLCNFSFHIYNKAIDTEADNRNNIPDNVKLSSFDIEKLKLTSYILCGISLFLIIITKQNIFAICIYISMVYLYNIPYIEIKKTIFIKNLYMALFYALPFTLFLHFYNGKELSYLDSYIFLNYILIVLAFESIWDIKDIDGDKSVGITTIPIKYGISFTKVYAAILILISIIIQYYLFNQFNIIAILMILIYILLLRKKSSHIQYHLPVIIILAYQYYILFPTFYFGIKNILQQLY